jgi:hypothetical protein
LGLNIFGKPSKKDTKGWPAVEFTPGFQMVSATQALAWDNWEMAGKLIDRPVRQSSWPGIKREGSWFDDKLLRSEPRKHHGVESWDMTPPDYGDHFRSSPYTGNLVLTDEDDVTEEYGITPDGMVDQLMIDAMMPDRKWTKDVR